VDLLSERVSSGKYLAVTGPIPLNFRVQSI
jgi:hypothetical protein